MSRVDQRNVAHYWIPGQVGDLSLLHADFTTHEYAPHSHDASVIAVTETGGAQIWTPGHVEWATPGTIFVSNPAEPQAAWLGASRRWRYRAFYLGQAAIAEVARSLGVDRLPSFPPRMLTDADLVTDLTLLHRALETNRDADGQQLLIDTIGRLFQRHGSGGSRIATPPTEVRLLRRMQEEVRARYAERLSLTELGRPLGLTRFQLIGLFRRGLGLTPHRYLVQVRLAEARRLLARGEPIAVAAAASGFYDQSALTRHFKRCYGITPLQFARATARDRGQGRAHG